jgi:hypothetical protein
MSKNIDNKVVAIGSAIGFLLFLLFFILSGGQFHS